MKYLKILLMLLAAVSFTTAQKKSVAKKETSPKKEPVMFQIKTQEDSVSYSIGQNIAANLKDPNMKINFEALFAGMKDGVEGKSTLSPTEMQQIMMGFNDRMMAIRSEQMKIEQEKKRAEMGPEIEKNKKEQEAFLAENKKKEGVVETASGLQYKVLTKGTGTVSPKDTNTVKVHYTGKFIDGNIFDSSVQRNEPAEFPLNQVIKGWTEGLQLMNTGDKFEFYIPYELAYGEEGREGAIPPASLLIFEVELLEIK
ncbi:MAG: FKBP-type peptidyl-prolyl cis-trans isomerase [Ignavibacteria bacterium]|nr:MAG: FKBP-type peptidyl-prolyl cis-trans isomerase [Ignavibacteria bacterium]KAF0161849.1 MAG: FKBP-type peptidyl-prolyl cis-trans isomerase [Ignavibacteria bacterium]